MAGNRPRILFVKKVLANGEACRKCRDVEARLRRDRLMASVDETLEAREGDPASPGARLAAGHGIDRAPFFVLRYPDGREHVIESYLAFKRWLSRDEATVQDLVDVVDQHPGLAFL